MTPGRTLRTYYGIAVALLLILTMGSVALAQDRPGSNKQPLHPMLPAQR